MKKLAKGLIFGATLKWKLIIGGSLALIALLVILAIGIFQSIIGGSGDDSSQDGEFVDIESGSQQISETVEQYRDDVEYYAKEYEVEEYVDVLLAMMEQESSGKGSDPFQASESKCGYIGCITDPKESIEQGVKYFSEVLEQAEGDVELTLQSYNFGGGFIDFVLDKGESYSKELAIEFSSMKYAELRHTGIYSCIHPEYSDVGACYGDVEYVDNVLRYYQPVSSDQLEGVETANASAEDGDFASPVETPLVTSEFGNRTHPVTGEVGKFHSGIDFGCNNGVTNILSSANGEVVFSDWSTGYGNTVIVQHDDNLYTHYAHMSSNSVSVGDSVSQGEEVGVCGSTGQSTGPHLHFEVKEEAWGGHNNPRDYIDVPEIQS
ncbi:MULTISPECIES: lysozyme family protein [Oceanobacillus]|uniref:lysozyme family protein n=1 Tax=Oceanobacillus TaxID=182709 RepID=UPI0009BA9141|nr:lysozyme family protein [Oceanobacillus timonensis]